MYVNDPNELTLRPKLLVEVADEEPRDYHEFFWDEAVQRGRHLSPERQPHTQVCRFDGAGEHVTMAKDCPHFEMEDEMGRRIATGWTVQHNG